ncbi:hypothetical protein ElyMa_000939400 [Elysia marginata]|uniref:Uncharacterized protein n=1 Tax=Elysia marginata TaxID=1093978 RepID=A0AAV4HEL1_9GAST|nr:hypothetical protein ElyMa_000939400 [Elysia marginata]
MTTLDYWVFYGCGHLVYCVRTEEDSGPSLGRVASWSNEASGVSRTATASCYKCFNVRAVTLMNKLALPEES